MKSFVKSVLFAGLGVGCLALGTGAQTPPPPVAPAAPAPVALPGQAVVVDGTTGVYTARVAQAQGGDRLWIYGDQSHGEAVRLAKQIADAKSDTDKEKLRDKLKDVLNKAFDARQKQHEQEIAALEKQIDRLKKMVEKRQENKKEIIEERTKQLLREAQGLGW